MTTTDETMAPSIEHAQFLRIALEALSVRAARWTTLLMSFALFTLCGVAYSHGRLATAAVFTVLVHVPLWWKKEAR